MIENILLMVGMIALIVNVYGFIKLIKVHKAFLSGWYQIILKGIVYIVGFLQLFIIADLIWEFMHYYSKNSEILNTINLALFVAALLTTLSLVIISIINIRIAKEHGFK